MQQRSELATWHAMGEVRRGTTHWTQVTAHTCLAGCLVDRGTDTRSKAADLEGGMSAHLNLVDSVQWIILLLQYLDLQLYSVHILLDQPSSRSTAHAPASRGEKCVYLCLGFGKVVFIPKYHFDSISDCFVHPF